MKNKKNRSLYSRIGALLVCMTLLVAIAVFRDGTIWGHRVKGSASVASQADSTTMNTLPDGRMVLKSEAVAADVKGYAGATPIIIYIKENCIDSIEVLANNETPSFFQRVEDELICKYVGMTVEEALAADVDAVSGATFSSNAVKKTVQLTLAQYKPDAKVVAQKDEQGGMSIGLMAALLVSLSAALVPLKIKSKTFRFVQLLLNVGVLGFWTGTFVSYSSTLNILSNGVTLWQMTALLVLMIVAFVYPLFGKRGYYCAWCCPMGSLQDLAGRTMRGKLVLSQSATRVLRIFRLVLWLVLMVLSLTGVCLEWMNYELFAAFIWQSASWLVIAFAALTVVLSVFITRPYCRFVCPTGTLLKTL